MPENDEEIELIAKVYAEKVTKFSDEFLADIEERLKSKVDEGKANALIEEIKMDVGFVSLLRTFAYEKIITRDVLSHLSDRIDKLEENQSQKE